jgi:hypothetical protein
MVVADAGTASRLQDASSIEERSFFIKDSQGVGLGGLRSGSDRKRAIVD